MVSKECRAGSGRRETQRSRPAVRRLSSQTTHAVQLLTSDHSCAGRNTIRAASTIWSSAPIVETWLLTISVVQDTYNNYLEDTTYNTLSSRYFLEVTFTFNCSFVCSCILHTGIIISYFYLQCFDAVGWAA